MKERKRDGGCLLLSTGAASEETLPPSLPPAAPTINSTPLHPYHDFSLSLSLCVSQRNRPSDVVYALSIQMTAFALEPRNVQQYPPLYASRDARPARNLALHFFSTSSPELYSDPLSSSLILCGCCRLRIMSTQAYIISEKLNGRTSNDSRQEIRGNLLHIGLFRGEGGI